MKREGGDEPGCVYAVVHDRTTAVVWFWWGGEVCGGMDVGGSERELQRQQGGGPKREGEMSLGGTAFLWLDFGFYHPDEYHSMI